MKVLVITHTHIPTVGGAQIRWHKLSNALKELGVEMTLLTPCVGSNSALKTFSPVNYGLIRYPYPNRLGSRPRLHQLLTFIYGSLLLLTGKYDAIQANMMYPSGWIASKLGKLFNLPVIVTTAGEDVNQVKEINYGHILKSELIKKRILETAKRVTAVVGMSPSLCLAAQKLGVDKNRTFLIPNGFNPIQETGNKKKADQVLRLIMVGRYHPVKNIEPVIHALSLLSDIPIHLTIIGKGVSELTKLRDKLKLKDRIVLYGGLPQLEVFNKMVESDVLINSSWVEGAPQVVQHAVALKIPVIASNVPGNRDFVSEKNGYLVSPDSPAEFADAIRSCYHHENLKSLGEKGNSHTYEWQVIAQKYKELYEFLVNGKSLKDGLHSWEW